MALSESDRALISKELNQESPKIEIVYDIFFKSDEKTQAYRQGLKKMVSMLGKVTHSLNAEYSIGLELASAQVRNALRQMSSNVYMGENGVFKLMNQQSQQRQLCNNCNTVFLNCLGTILDNLYGCCAGNIYNCSDLCWVLYEYQYFACQWQYDDCYIANQCCCISGGGGGGV